MASECHRESENSLVGQTREIDSRSKSTANYHNRDAYTINDINHVYVHD